MTFLYRTIIQLYHTDAAGILFYSHIFTLAHDAYDAFLQKIGKSVSYIINESDFLLPYIHAEADYLKPIRIGDELVIYLKIDKIGKTSFTVKYSFVNSQKQKVAEVKTVHVSIEKSTGEKRELPADLKKRLEEY